MKTLRDGKADAVVPEGTAAAPARDRGDDKLARRRARRGSRRC